MIFVAIITVVDVAFADVSSAKASLNSIQINENTDPEIAALYKEISDIIAEYDTIHADYISKLEENAQKMRDKEQSTENKLLGATGIGTVGIGGMQTLSAMAEQKADDAADQDMRAYLATFRCDYGAGRNITGGETNIQLPSASDLAEYVSEYRALALNLQADKAALGLTPGIESETVFDSATMNLYNNVGIGTQKGAFTSLARALMDENSADAAELSEMYKDTLKKRQTGTALAVGGAVATIATDLALNSGEDKKEKSDQITLEYDKQKRRIDQKISDKENALQIAIDKNKKKIEDFNKLLKQHQDFVATLTEPECAKDFAQYISDINAMQPISDMLSNTANLPTISYDLDEMRKKYTQCLVDLCNKNPYKEWVNGECRDKVVDNGGANDAFGGNGGVNPGGGSANGEETIGGGNGASDGSDDGANPNGGNGDDENPDDGIDDNGGANGASDGSDDGANPNGGNGDDDSGKDDGEPNDDDVPNPEEASEFDEEECAKYPQNYYWDKEQGKCLPIPDNGVIPGTEPGKPHSGYNADGTLSASGMTYQQWEAWVEQHRKECEAKENWTWDAIERTCFENPPLNSPQCPRFNPRFPEIVGGNVGGACAGNFIIAGDVIKIKTGEDAGTCDCSARVCKQIGDKLVQPDGTELDRVYLDKRTVEGVQMGVCVERVGRSPSGICSPFYEFVIPSYRDAADRKNAASRACRKKCNAGLLEHNCKNENPQMGLAYIGPSNAKNADVYRCTCAADDEYFQERENQRVQDEQVRRLSLMSVEYVHTCPAFGATPKPNRGLRCEEDVFKDIQVTRLQALGLVQMYIAHKYSVKKDDVVCEDTFFQSGNDDWLRCYDMDNLVNYEFRFDDLKESIDSTIDDSVNKAMCHNILGLPYIDTPPVCNVSKASDCLMLNELFSRYMAIGTKWSQNKCHITSGSRVENPDLQTYADIDNTVFCKGIQLQGSGSVQKYLEQYIKNTVRSRLGTEPRKIRCDNNRRRIRPMCGGGSADDVLRCYADGHPIDFVFDDLSEAFDYNTDAGLQAMACVAAQGTFTGENCIGIGEQQCRELSADSAKTCPKCKKVYWDAKNNICTLPAAEFAADANKAVAIGTMAGAAVVAVVVTVASMGTGSGAGAAIVLVTIETAGAAIEIGSTVVIGQVAQQFLIDTNQCHDATCAERIIRSSMQRMANLSNDFTDAEIAAIDTELARLLNLVPEDSELWDKTTIEMYEKGFFDPASWEPEQVVRAVGVVMQFASVITSLWKGVNRGLTKAGNVVKEKMTAVERNLARAKTRLTKMTKGSRAYTKQAERITELERQAGIVDDARHGRDVGNLSGESNSVRQSARQAQRDVNPFTADQIANDGAKLKRYDQLLEKQRTGKLTQTEQQELSRIRNEWGNPTDDVIEAARRVSLRNANAAELASAEEDLRKWEQWAQQNPGRLKNMSRADRDRVVAMRKRVSDLGGDPDAISPISANPEIAGRTPATARAADDAVEHTADDALDAAAEHIDESAYVDDAVDVATGHIDDADDVVRISDNAAEQVDDVMPDADDIVRTRNFAVQFKNAEGRTVQLSRNSRYWDLVDGKIDLNTPLTRIGNVDVKLVDFPSGGKVGRIAGRPIVVVDVGGRKIPFYVSSGMAGKTSVPTGKWEAIFGIGEYNGKSSWFNKGNLDDILAHYDSPELKQIADALDSRLGDLRDTIDVGNSALRKVDGGIGDVASSTLLPDVDGVENLRFLNSGMGASPSVTNRDSLSYNYNKRSISTYLKQLTGADVTDDVRALRNMRGNLEDMVEFNPNVDNFVTDVATDTEIPVQIVDGVTDNIVAQVVDIPALRNKASKKFDMYLTNFKDSGQSVGLPYERLSDDEWRILNNELASDGVRMEMYQKNGKYYMQFVDDTSHPAGAARVSARQANVANSNRQFIEESLSRAGAVTKNYAGNNVYISAKMRENDAANMVSAIEANGDFAVALNIEGYRDAPHIVIAMTREDAIAQGFSVSGRSLTRAISNPNIANLQNRIGKNLGSIHGMPIYIESINDVGVRSGRAICMVKVGERKIPFYISTGTAGKTNVPTGKWEFFGGIGNNGWFNKGGIEDIVNHYDSPELKQIADILDAQIGDLRNTEFVLETMGRNSLGGQGIVGFLENFQGIGVDDINRYFRYQPNSSSDRNVNAFRSNLADLKNYLRNL